MEYRYDGLIQQPYFWVEMYNRCVPPFTLSTLFPLCFFHSFIVCVCDSTFFQQASNTELVTAQRSNHFYGWMDDLAFYNRVLSVEEIANNWQKAVDTTDSSLFLYYNFDEGPGSTLIRNYGTIGSQANLYNGQVHSHSTVLFHIVDQSHSLTICALSTCDQVLGSTTYLEVDSSVTFPVKPAMFTPGVPVIGASSSLPVVFAVDVGATVRLRIACQLTTTTTTAASLIPSLAKFVTLPSETGKIYQTDINQTPITNLPTALTGPAAEFWYSASTTIIGSPIIDSMQYSCVCNGVTQTGTINVIVNPVVVPDQTISLVVPGTTTTINLHGSLANPGLMKVNITSLPTLGYLSQLNFQQPNLITPITKVSQSNN